MRDLTKTEISRMFSREGISIVIQDVSDIPVSLESWMSLTSTNPEAEKQIRDFMENDISGGNKTGFHPYLLEENIFFNHHWAYTPEIK